jgi:hypothetical protein
VTVFGFFGFLPILEEGGAINFAPVMGLAAGEESTTGTFMNLAGICVMQTDMMGMVVQERSVFQNVGTMPIQEG